MQKVQLQPRAQQLSPVQADKQSTGVGDAFTNIAAFGIAGIGVYQEVQKEQKAAQAADGKLALEDGQKAFQRDWEKMSAEERTNEVTVKELYDKRIDEAIKIRGVVDDEVKGKLYEARDHGFNGHYQDFEHGRYLAAQETRVGDTFKSFIDRGDLAGAEQFLSGSLGADAKEGLKSTNESARKLLDTLTTSHSRHADQLLQMGNNLGVLTPEDQSKFTTIAGKEAADRDDDFRRGVKGAIANPTQENWEAFVVMREGDLARENPRYTAAQWVAMEKEFVTAGVEISRNNYHLDRFIRGEAGIPQRDDKNELSIGDDGKPLPYLDSVEKQEDFMEWAQPRFIQIFGPEEGEKRYFDSLMLHGWVDPKYSRVMKNGVSAIHSGIVSPDLIPRATIEGYAMYERTRSYDPSLAQRYVGDSNYRLYQSIDNKRRFQDMSVEEAIVATSQVAQSQNTEQVTKNIVDSAYNRLGGDLEDAANATWVRSILRDGIQSMMSLGDSPREAGTAMSENLNKELFVHHGMAIPRKIVESDNIDLETFSMAANGTLRQIANENPDIEVDDIGFTAISGNRYSVVYKDEGFRPVTGKFDDKERILTFTADEIRNNKARFGHLKLKEERISMPTNTSPYHSRYPGYNY